MPKLTKRLKVRYIALLAVILQFSSMFIVPLFRNEQVEAGWVSGYTYRKTITIDADQVSGSTDFSNFPMLFSVTDPSLKTLANGGRVRNASGFDIIFTLADGSTQLNHEIEYYSATSGNFVAWVKIPTLGATVDTLIYMYYSNASIASSQENITGVWSSSFSMVHHLNTGATTYLDSTSYNNDAAIGGTPSGGNTTGQIAGGYGFAIDNSYMSITNQASQTPASNYTMTAWVKPTTCGESYNGKVLEKKNVYALTVIDETSGGKVSKCGLYFNYGASQTPTVSTVVALGSWSLIGVTYDGTRLKIWTNGQIVANTVGSYGLSAAAVDLWLGARDNGMLPAGQEFDGVEDEVRIVSTNRVDDWMITEYNNQSNPATFFVEGGEQTNATPSIANISLNGGVDISLVENTTVTVNWTATVTDTNGYSDIGTVNGVVYRSGAGSKCVASPNNCYTDASCDLSGCAGNSCTATCSADIYFYAESTDASSLYPAEYWQAWMQVTDLESHSASGTSAAGSPELLSLMALDTTSSISYNPLFAGQDSGGANQEITITNTGNLAIDCEITGYDMCLDYPTCALNRIALENQQYGLAKFTYPDGIPLSALPATLNISLVKQSTAVPSTTKMYWGIGIPAGSEPGSYTGKISIGAVDDQVIR